MQIERWRERQGLPPAVRRSDRVEGRKSMGRGGVKRGRRKSVAEEGGRVRDSCGIAKTIKRRGRAGGLSRCTWAAASMTAMKKKEEAAQNAGQMYLERTSHEAARENREAYS
jgi:hypothetical protein